MHEDSPSNFIRFSAPTDLGHSEPYQRALDLVTHVHEVLESAGARFHLKDRLDRSTTSIVMLLGQADAEPKTVRWRHYRKVLQLATDVSTLLDILQRQRATVATEGLTQARATVRQLISQLGPLTLG